MRRSAAFALVLVAAGCGGHGSKQAQSSTAAANTTASTPLQVTITAPTHHPRVNVPWPVTVRAVDSSGKPVAATVTMQILFNGSPVGKVDNGRVYYFVGTWRETKGNEITWPAASRGQPLAFEAIVSAKGKTVKRTWSIAVK